MTVRERMALDVEARQWRFLGAKEAHVREMLGWTLTRHALEVNRLIDDPEAAAFYPVLVARLRRIRESRRAVRRRAFTTPLSS